MPAPVQRGVTIMRSHEIVTPGAGCVSLHVAKGSVLDFCGDAFVNAANEGCVGGFGLDEMVNRAGGFELKEARKRLGGCPTGQARITGAFGHSKTNFIIHAVGPVYRSNRVQAPARSVEELDLQLNSAYRSALILAEQQKGQIQTLAFCLLSCGVFRGEASLVHLCRISLESIREELQRAPADDVGAVNFLREVFVVAYTLEEEEALLQAADIVLGSN
jgi:O-acetyl-ADP-ribose deacetylase (regulator of RNase III)